MPPALEDYKPIGTGATSPGQSERMGFVIREYARDKHDAAVGRLVLVLPAILRPAQ